MNREQLKTILWLRWRLMCNQWRRTGGLGAVIAVFVGVGAIGLGMLSFTGALLGAVFGLAKVPPMALMAVWLGVTAFFLFFWMIGLLTELQRSETIDLQKLMHLPVALGQMFGINYLVSHFSLSIILMVPAMLGLALGLTIERGPGMLLMIPLALSMVLMITAWTYCLRGWLSTLMTNPRRRRTVIMGITMAFILLAQGPNIYFNVFQRGWQGSKAEHRGPRDAADKKMLLNLVAAEKFIPPLWVPLGALNLAGGNVLPALLGTLGCAGFATLGLRRAYRSTVKFYHGETGGKSAAKTNTSSSVKKPAPPRAAGKIDFLERHIPFVQEQSAAVALATLRSLLRAPEVKMTWATSLVVTLILGATFFLRSTANISEVMKPFLATGSVVFPIFFLTQFFVNQFGFDRDGFRAFMLSPADRRLILIGKNLAGLPVGFLFGILLITLTTIRLHLPTETVLATLFQLVSLLFMAGLAGNLLSILVPFRIQPGSMKPTKVPGLAMVAIIVFQMLFPLAMTPVFAGPLLGFLWQHWDLPHLVPVNLVFSVVFCGLMAVAYWTSLPHLGRLLHRRETKILGTITVEVE